MPDHNALMVDLDRGRSSSDSPGNFVFDDDPNVPSGLGRLAKLAFVRTVKSNWSRPCLSSTRWGFRVEYVRNTVNQLPGIEEHAGQHRAPKPDVCFGRRASGFSL